MPVLVVNSGSSPEQIIQLTEAETVIGRQPGCHIVLDPNGVSRKHARITRNGERFCVEDLHSRNHTKLNEKILPPGQEHPLQPGDRINICDVEMVFYTTLPDPEHRKPERASTDGLEVTEGEESTIHLLDASRSDLLASIVKPEVKLKAILEISRNLSSSLKNDAVAPKILDSLLELFVQAERAFMVLLKFDGPKWTVRQTFHKVRPSKRAGGLRLGTTPADESRLRISRSIISHVIDQRKAVLSQDAGNDLNLPTSASIADLKIRSVLCVPLLATDGQILGILQLDTSDRKQFNQDDLDVLLAVAGQAAIALQNAAMHESLVAQERIRRDLALAQTIQMRFLPQTVPAPAGYEFFAHYHAAYEVGGDYYDFVELGPGRLAFALGDVAGKGVAAAMMMAKFSGDTRACLLTESGPAAAMTRLNRLVCGPGIEDKFMTMSLGMLDLERRTLTLASAGHLPPLLRRADGTVIEVGEELHGLPLGIDTEVVYDQIEVALAPGDVVVVYSDGVTEARNPGDDMYDSVEDHRLNRRVAEAAGGPTAVARAVLQDLREFMAGTAQFDDITLVCFGPRG